MIYTGGERSACSARILQDSGGEESYYPNWTRTSCGSRDLPSYPLSMPKVTTSQPSPLARLLVVGTLAAGCGGGGASEPPPDNMSPSVTEAGGNGQSGVVGQVLANPLQAQVTQGGQPASNVTVNWSTTAANGVMTPASGTTDANGVASSSWTLGSVSGSQTAQATVSEASGSPVAFTATALSDAAAALAKADGDGQTGDINTQLAEPVQARVTDQFGNGVEGTSVSWTATGAAVSASSVISNATGISQVSVTLGGTAGPITITAEATGLTGSPLSFSATAVTPAPAPSSINVTVSNNLFRSNQNSSTNPAVDTVAVNGTVIWTWVATGQTSHNVDSDGSPAFPSSSVLTGNGQNYSFQFTATGTYQYTCAIHPGQMTGRVVVR